MELGEAPEISMKQMPYPGSLAQVEPPKDRGLAHQLYGLPLQNGGEHCTVWRWWAGINRMSGNCMSFTSWFGASDTTWYQKQQEKLAGGTHLKNMLVKLDRSSPIFEVNIQNMWSFTTKYIHMYLPNPESRTFFWRIPLLYSRGMSYKNN